MMRFIFLILIILFTNCSNNIKFYEKNYPKANAKEFFTGKLSGFGTVFDYRDRSSTRFKINGFGKMENEKLIFEEKITYYDNTQDNNTRILTFNGNKFNLEIVKDMPNGGTGEFLGNVINMKYDLLLGKEDASVNFSCNDWIYMIDDKNAINKIIMKKFGITVAEVVMYIKKE